MDGVNKTNRDGRSLQRVFRHASAFNHALPESSPLWHHPHPHLTYLSPPLCPRRAVVTSPFGRMTHRKLLIWAKGWHAARRPINGHNNISVTTTAAHVAAARQADFLIWFCSSWQELVETLGVIFNNRRKAELHHTRSFLHAPRVITARLHRCKSHFLITSLWFSWSVRCFCAEKNHKVKRYNSSVLLGV